MSTDSRLDILDAFKGTILRSCCQIELPMILIPEINQQVFFSKFLENFCLLKF